MSKSKHSKPEEFLLGELRQLRKENKSLKQRLKQLEKHDRTIVEKSQEEEISSDSEDTMFHPALKAIPCTDCGKGHYIEYEIMGRIIGTCGICGNRKRLK